MQRRQFLSSASVLTAGLLLPGRTFAQAPADLSKFSEAFVPVRAITKGPAFHWFGYYDKLQFDPTNRFVLSNQVSFEHRTPTADDRIKGGMIDLEDGDRWTELGKSDAWGWQQGCMLQWRPGSNNEVVWNDREKDQFVCRIKNIETGEVKTIPKAIYALSPDGKWGVTADFARIQALRPGYGYQGVADPYIIDPSGYTSHFIWRDAEHITAWTRPEGKPDAFYLLKDKTQEVTLVGEGVMPKNGHNTYLTSGDGKEWILNDTYPTGEHRHQTPYLYHAPTNKRHELGNFHLPQEYTGEWRCDTHPRSSNDGKLVTVDSAHGGTGRQLWLLDVSEIVGCNSFSPASGPATGSFNGLHRESNR